MGTLSQFFGRGGGSSGGSSDDIPVKVLAVTGGMGGSYEFLSRSIPGTPNLSCAGITSSFGSFNIPSPTSPGSFNAPNINAAYSTSDGGEYGWRFITGGIGGLSIEQCSDITPGVTIPVTVGAGGTHILGCYTECCSSTNQHCICYRYGAMGGSSCFGDCTYICISDLQTNIDTCTACAQWFFSSQFKIYHDIDVPKDYNAVKTDTRHLSINYGRFQRISIHGNSKEDVGLKRMVSPGTFPSGAIYGGVCTNDELNSINTKYNQAFESISLWEQSRGARNRCKWNPPAPADGSCLSQYGSNGIDNFVDCCYHSGDYFLKTCIPSDTDNPTTGGMIYRGKLSGSVQKDMSDPAQMNHYCFTCATHPYNEGPDFTLCSDPGVFSCNPWKLECIPQWARTPSLKQSRSFSDQGHQSEILGNGVSAFGRGGSILSVANPWVKIGAEQGCELSSNPLYPTDPNCCTLNTQYWSLSRNTMRQTTKRFECVGEPLHYCMEGLMRLMTCWTFRRPDHPIYNLTGYGNGHPGWQCDNNPADSGTVIIQYPNDYGAATTTGPSVCDCSPQTPGCYTYRFLCPGSITFQ